jgi:hypothetical protein
LRGGGGVRACVRACVCARARRVHSCVRACLCTRDVCVCVHVRVADRIARTAPRPRRRLLRRRSRTARLRPVSPRRASQCNVLLHPCRMLQRSTSKLESCSFTSSRMTPATYLGVPRTPSTVCRGRYGRPPQHTSALQEGYHGFCSTPPLAGCTGGSAADRQASRTAYTSGVTVYSARRVSSYTLLSHDGPRPTPRTAPRTTRSE